MFAVLIGFLLIANAVLWQSSYGCDDLREEVRQQMCTDVADSLKGYGISYNCMDCKTKDNKPLRIFACDVTIGTDVKTFFLTPGEKDTKKVLSIETMQKVAADKSMCKPISRVPSEPYSPLKCDILL